MIRKQQFSRKAVVSISFPRSDRTGLAYSRFATDWQFRGKRAVSHRFSRTDKRTGLLKFTTVPGRQPFCPFPSSFRESSLSPVPRALGLGNLLPVFVN